MSRRPTMNCHPEERSDEGSREADDASVTAFAVYLALFHLHLLLDSYGSGPGWGIPYWWPFDREPSINPHAWAFYSWQNLGTAALLIGWTLWIARRHGRTPLEAIMPRLDRQLVAIIGTSAARGPAPQAEGAAQ